MVHFADLNIVKLADGGFVVKGPIKKYSYSNATMIHKATTTLSEALAILKRKLQG